MDLSLNNDIENNSFECPICFNEYKIIPLEYKCTVCNEKMCDDCCKNYISNNNKNCAFCRQKLEIDENLNIRNNLFELYKLHKCKIRIAIFMIVSWYGFLFFYFIMLSSKK